jgi:hypothetical protein
MLMEVNVLFLGIFGVSYCWETCCVKDVWLDKSSVVNSPRGYQRQLKSKLEM